MLNEETLIQCHLNIYTAMLWHRKNTDYMYHLRAIIFIFPEKSSKLWYSQLLCFYHMYHILFPELVIYTLFLGEGGGWMILRIVILKDQHLTWIYDLFYMVYILCYHKRASLRTIPCTVLLCRTNTILAMNILVSNAHFYLASTF